jgi:hypothetical protein
LAATFFKGLIKLAAAGVKARQGMPEGVRGHALRARELFEEVAAQLGADVVYMGLSPRELAVRAREIAQGAEGARLLPGEPVAG